MSALLGEHELRRIAEGVLAASEADQTEVLVHGGVSALTRFANSYIHQNVEERDLSVTVRAVLGKRIGVASTDAINPEGLKDVTQRALSLARLQRPNEDFRSLPGPAPAPKVDSWLQRTASFSPDERSAVVAKICDAARKSGLTAAGAFRTTESETAVANSLGVWAYHPETTADAETVVMGETSSGYAQRLSLDAGEIGGEELVREAIETCRRGADPKPIEPGAYDVVLGAYAVADLMDYFAYLSFGAQAYLEKRSFMSGRLGEKVMGENVSIWDDGLSLDAFPAPFDAEGVPRQRVELVTNGIAKDVVWDSYYGGIGNHPSTGHALPAGNTIGALPGNLFLAPGEASVDEMIAATKRGVLVTRFWYTRPVHPLTVVMTGMTRDGTFLIEEGRVSGPVRNMRFTQSYLDAMNHTEMLGRETMLLPSLAGSCRVPAIKVSGWNFTGATEF